MSNLAELYIYLGYLMALYQQQRIIDAEWIVWSWMLNLKKGRNMIIHEVHKEVSWSAPSTSESSCNASLSSVIPCIPLQSSSHFVHRNLNSDNHMMTFSKDKQFGVVDMCQRWLEGNTAEGKEVEASGSHLHRPWDFFLWPQSSINF